MTLPTVLSWINLNWNLIFSKDMGSLSSGGFVLFCFVFSHDSGAPSQVVGSGPPLCPMCPLMYGFPSSDFKSMSCLSLLPCIYTTHPTLCIPSSGNSPSFSFILWRLEFLAHSFYLCAFSLSPRAWTSTHIQILAASFIRHISMGKMLNLLVLPFPPLQNRINRVLSHTV